MKDYYDILGVAKDAGEEDIKKAFRKLAHQYHPDKQGGDEQKFKEVSEAYAVLSDQKKRAEYDTYGKTFAGGAGGQGFGGFDFSDFQNFAQNGGFDSAGFDFGDIFSDFFTGGRTGRTRRGRDISIDIELSFKESVFGAERTVLLTKVDTCKTCEGNGAEKGSKMKTCEQCNGKGQVRETRKTFLGEITSVRECQHCNGRGEIPEKTCKTCAGSGTHKQEEEIKIAVPSGIQDGEMIRMPGRGEAIQGGVHGDLYVKVHVQQDERFRREEDNILTTLPVKLTDALLGAKHKIETLDGTIDLHIPVGVSHGETLRVKGKGVPTTLGRGDLMVRVEIQMPQKLSRTAKKCIQELQEEGL